MPNEKKYIYVKWAEDEFYPIQQLLDELSGERRGRIYNNRAIVEAVEFYLKYRKLVEGTK